MVLLVTYFKFMEDNTALVPYSGVAIGVEAVPLLVEHLSLKPPSPQADSPCNDQAE